LRRRLRQELLALWRRSGATVLFVTHDLSEAAELAQRIIVLSARPARVRREITVSVPHEARRDDAGVLGPLDRELAELLSEAEGDSG
jgi:ABC-type nitrate/sulfonate/bicarbonate transport system ATPase subunit